MGFVKFALLAYMATYPTVDPAPTVHRPPIQQVGKATWYGAGNWHGTYTATGERFRPDEISCAHRTLSLGAVIMIQDLNTGRSIWCRVNDRGPYMADHKGQMLVKMDNSTKGKWRSIVDLSRGAARALAKGTPTHPPNFRIAVRYWTTLRSEYKISYLD